MKKFIKFFLIITIAFNLTPNLDSAENYQNKILKYVNQERKNKKLAPLVMNEKLNKIAVKKADDMAKDEKLSHNSKNFGATFNLIKNENIKYKSAGENIAKWHDTPEFVMERWMQSKGHRDNILNKNYNEIGIGKAVDKNGKNYWVQIFIEKKK
ncbi:MAG: CAP domain-containing protein [Fusobacterium sp.]|nr:CAP domain-containing protein [Fusobacterium sp.]